MLKAKTALWVDAHDSDEEIEESIEVEAEASPFPRSGGGAGEGAFRDLSVLQRFEQLLSSKAQAEEEGTLSRVEHPSLALDESCDSELSARPTEFAATAGSSSSLDLSGSEFAGTNSLAIMMKAVRDHGQETSGFGPTTAEDLRRGGLGHLAPLLPHQDAAAPHLAATMPVGGGAPLAFASLGQQPVANLAQTCPLPPRTLAGGFNGACPLAPPTELQLPDSGSDRSRPSSAEAEAGQRRCTPVLRRARMRSPDEDGVMMPMPASDERPGEYGRRRRPWHAASSWGDEPSEGGF